VGVKSSKVPKPTNITGIFKKLNGFIGNLHFDVHWGTMGYHFREGTCDWNSLN
jgi:hypothetical protein